jgi:hypothetical protein
MPAANSYRQPTQGDQQMNKLWTESRIVLCVCLGMLPGGTLATTSTKVMVLNPGDKVEF